MKLLRYLSLRILSHKYFETLKIYLKYLRGYPPLVIYQMGKVGSVTIYKTLIKNVKNPVLHVHFLTPSEIERVKNKYLKAGITHEPQHLRHSRILSDRLKTSKSRKWYVITLVRDPISAKLSHLFHNPKIHRQYLFDKNGNIDNKRALEVAYDDLMNFDASSDYVCNWISKEFCNYLEVDLYKYPFDKERGFQIIEEEEVIILVLQMESIDKSFSNALQEMQITHRDIQIVKSNENESKEFSEIYKFVKNNIKLPAEKMREIYNSKYVRHFYSNAFISNQMNRWVN